MTEGYKVALVGATGLVGTEMLNILSERGFPIRELLPLASPKSAGKKVTCVGKDWTVQALSKDVFKDVDICLMSAGGQTSKDYAPLIAASGAVVIDNSSQWRMDPDVPLVVPEVNPSDIASFKKKNIIANPNCSTIQMVVSLAPLHDAAKLKRVVVSTYQAVSGAGKKAMDELGRQVTDLFNQQEIVPKVFPKRIAFNCLPHIDVFEDDEYTREEHKMHHETRKILGDESIGVCATCVRVPVFNGHAESILAEFHHAMDAGRAKELLKTSPGILLSESLADNNELSYPTQIDCEGNDATYVGRIRNDPSAQNSIAMWCVSDNLRKGAATNAVQIAEILIRDYLSPTA
jgi:aspartate-semialdehyde dehydrogenase